MALSHLRNLLPALPVPAERVDLGELESFFFFLFFFCFARKPLGKPKLFFFNFIHAKNYNTLHLQFITGNYYRLQKKEINKKKRKDKVHQNTIVYILTIKRRLSALLSSITHPPVCCLYFNYLYWSNYILRGIV